MKHIFVSTLDIDRIFSTRPTQFLLTLPPPAPLKLRPNGAIQIYY